MNVIPGGDISSSISRSIASGHFTDYETVGAGMISYTSQFGPNFTSTLMPGAAGEFVSGEGSLISGSLKVTYDYTAAPTGAVPEPAGWALMILGFGGAGVMLRRRTAMAA